MQTRARSRGALAAWSILAICALSGCTGGATGSPLVDATSTPTPTPSTVAPTDAQTLTSAASGWIAGNRVALTGASYDPDSGVVTVSARVENTANTESFEGHFAESVRLAVGEGAPLAASRFSSLAAPLATTAIDIEFVAGPEGVALADAVLLLGGPGEATWRVPLAFERVGEGAQPSAFPVEGTADAGGLAFTASRGEVLPWACWDVDDYGPGGSGRVWYLPGAEDEVAVVVWGDITESVAIVGGDTPATVVLRQPDGTASPQIGTVNTVFDLNESITDYPLCFTVPTPAGGDYELVWNSYRGASAVLPIHIPAG